MSNRTFQVQFNIEGSLSGGLTSALNRAQSQLKGLGNAAATSSNRMRAALEAQQRGLLRISAASAKYAATQSQIGQTMRQIHQQGTKVGELKRQWQESERAVQSLKDKLSSLKAEFKANKRSMSVGDQSAFQAQIRSVQSALQSQKQATSSAKADYTAAARSLQSLQRALQSQQAALRTESSALTQANFNTREFASSQAALRSQLEQTTAALERQARVDTARQNRDNASANLSNAYGNFQNSLSTAGQIMSPFKSTIEDAMSFEQKMSELRSISQIDLIRGGNLEQANKNMALLKKQAKDLGRQTIYTGEQVLDAHIKMARTGMNTDSIIAATEPLLKLAASQGTSFNETADIATNIMMGFGMAMDDARNFSHVADVLSYETTHSNSDLRMLGESMKYAAPVAKQFGSSIEETAAMLGVMHDSGIQGSMAGTSLRQTMLRLIAPPKKATKAMQENGITVSDATKAWQQANEIAKEYGVTLDANAKPGQQMASIIEQLDKNMAGMSGHEKMAAFSAITGINAVSGATSLFDRGSDYLKDMTEALRNSDGTLENVYKEMTDNTWGASESFKSAWDAMSHSIGDAFLPAIKAGLEGITPLINKVDEFVQAHPRVVMAAGAMAAAIAAIGVGASGLALVGAATQFASAQFAFLNARLMASRLGMLLFGASTAATNATLTSLTWTQIGTSIKTAFVGAYQAVIAKATAAQAAVTAFWARVQAQGAASVAVSALQSLGSGFLSVARSAMAFAFSPVGVALMAIGLAGMYAYQNWDKVAPIFSALSDVIGGALTNSINMLIPAFSSLSSTAQRLGPALSYIGAVAFGAFATILNVVVRVGATIIQTFAAAIKTVIDMFSGLGGAISSLLAGDFSGAWEQLKSTGAQAADNIANTFKTAFRGIGDTVTHALDPIEQMQKSDAQIKLERTASVAMQSAPSSGLAFDDAMIDTSQVQSGMDAAGQAAQRNADAQDQAAQSINNIQSGAEQFMQNLTGMGEGMPQITEGLTNVNAELPTMQTNANGVNTELTNMQTQITTANPLIQQHGAAAQTATPQIQTLGQAAQSAASQVQGLGSALSQISSAAGSVASALSSKATEIASIKISAPSVSNVASNAQGGIYKRGAFLTTFAESSAEAAIPLDNSRRSKSLWESAGQMLGLLPGQPKNFADAEPSPPSIEEVQRGKAQGNFDKLSDRVKNSRSGQAMQRAINAQNRQSKSVLNKQKVYHDGNLNLGSISPVGMKFGGNILGGDWTQIFKGGMQLPGMPSLQSLNKKQQTQNIPMRTTITSPQVQSSPTTNQRQSNSILNKQKVRHDGNLNLGSISPVGMKFGGNILGGDWTQIFKGGMQLPGLPSLQSLNKTSGEFPLLKNVVGKGELTEPQFGSTPAPSDNSNLPPINLTITVNGNADATTIQDSGEKLSVDLFSKLEDWWRGKQRDSQRRSFL